MWTGPQLSAWRPAPLSSSYLPGHLWSPWHEPQTCALAVLRRPRGGSCGAAASCTVAASRSPRALALSAASEVGGEGPGRLPRRELPNKGEKRKKGVTGAFLES